MTPRVPSSCRARTSTPSLPSVDMRSIRVRADDCVGPTNRQSTSPQTQKASGPDSDHRVTEIDHHRRKGAEDDLLGSEPVVDDTTEKRTEGGDDAGADAEQQHVGARYPVGADAENGAEGEHSGQAVAENRAGEQVVDDVVVAAPFADDFAPQPAVRADETDARSRVARGQAAARAPR